jgi:transcription elongation GreA/GreB family factor
MSVAFRRESDEEHLEPSFELPIPPGPNLVTPRGLRQIEERSAALEEQLAGDLSDEQRKKVLRDARYWRQRLASAQLAPTPTGKTVAVRTRVTYTRDGQQRTIEVVGHDESDPTTDRVSFLAPLVRAMLGAEEGDEVDYAGGTLNVLSVASAS